MTIEDAKKIIADWENEMNRRMRNLKRRGYPRALYSTDIKEIIVPLIDAAMLIGREEGREERLPHPYTSLAKQIEIIAKTLQGCAISEETCQIARYADGRVRAIREDYMLENLRRQNEELHKYILELEKKLPPRSPAEHIR